jgi:Phage integrase family
MGRKTKNHDLPKYCRRVKTRHGRTVIQYSRYNRAPFIQIDAIPGTPEFYAVYATLRAGETITKAAKTQGPKLPPTTPNTWRWLCNRFIQHRYASTKRVTGAKRDKRILDGYCQQPLKRDNPNRLYADLPLGKLTANHLDVLIERTAERGLGAANIAVGTLKRLCRYAFKKDILPTDLSLKLEERDHVEKHHPPWEPADFDKYQQHYGNDPHKMRVLAVLFHTGTAIIDAGKLGWHSIHDDAQAKAWGAKVCRGIRQKTSNNPRPGEFNMPVSQAFLDLMGKPLADQKVVGLTFITNKWGKPYSGRSLGGAFSEWCKKAGIGKTAHGIRAAAAIRMAMRGATAHELCWMFGWSTLAEAERYTREADRRRGGAGAARLLEPIINEAVATTAARDKQST